MKVIAIIVAVVLGMTFVGWLTFDRSDDGASATIRTEEIRKDTKTAVQEGEQLLDEAVEKGKQALRNDNSGN